MIYRRVFAKDTCLRMPRLVCFWQGVGLLKQDRVEVKDQNCWQQHEAGRVDDADSSRIKLPDPRSASHSGRGG